MVLSFRTSTFARNIYVYGVERFTARDGYGGIPPEYYTPVEQFAADRYTTAEIDNALVQGWINQTECDETIALKGAGDPA
jgi:hypothetical protein